MTTEKTVRAGTILALGIACLLTFACAHRVGPDGIPRAAANTLQIFKDNIIHFTPEDPGRHDTVQVEASEDGKVISRTIEMRAPTKPVRIMARVVTRPIPKDLQTVYDKWDRAGNVRLSRPGMPDVEIVKFVTAYGGVTEHEVDVSHLAPLLQGPCTFKGFVNTWISPGWEMDFDLTFIPSNKRDAPDWARALFYEQDVTEAQLRDGPVGTEIEIPDGLSRVVLHYLVSGHCTDGRGPDEFETTDHVVLVDGREAWRHRPWRDDCLQFRAINPYCRRWSDGSWSSDYSRSGWCPGDAVLPVPVDLTALLTPGSHTITVNVEGIRPEDEEGHFGYWRISGYLLGWQR